MPLKVAFDNKFNNVPETKLSANQKWKRSGTDLSFREWISQQDAISNAENKNTATEEEVPPKPHYPQYRRFVVDNSIQNKKQLVGEDTSQIFGISKTALIIAGVILFGTIAFVVYKNVKEKE